MMSVWRRIFFILGLLFLVVFSSRTVGAQFTGVEFTNSYPIADKDAADGDILVSSASGLVRASLPYDAGMFGVLVTKPLVAVRSVSGDLQPVVRSGVALVTVTNFNGEIGRGDYVTSSEIAGKGQKAATSGYVLGVALDALTSQGGSQVNYKGKNILSGKIAVAIRVEYAEISNARSLARLFDALGGSFFQNVKDPGKLNVVIKYIAASLIMLLSVVFALFTFSRSVPKAVEAIGRNPLARGAIIFSLAMSVGLIVIILGAGIIASVIILRI